MEKFDVIIVGGGASGLMCALNIQNKKVLIIEKQDKIGKKILATGNGRCNLSNSNLTCEFYNTNLVNNYFKNFNNVDVIKYFKTLGLETYSDSEGRVYPISNYATSVLDCFRFNLEKKPNIAINLNENVIKISKEKNFFLIRTNINNYICDNVVFSVGGNFNNIFDFNIEFNPFSPCLCSLLTNKNKGLNGVKQKNVKATLIQNNKTNYQLGEILFKENSVSGILIFNLSNYYNEKQPAKLKLDLLPNITFENLIEELTNRKQIFVKTETLLTSYFHKQLAFSILEKSNVLTTINSNNLTDEDIIKITTTIKNYELSVLGKENNNQIYSGGISLHHLNQNLMHKNYNNLYITGEACDVSGLCGGYNLQWAFTSGKIVASDINNK